MAYTYKPSRYQYSDSSRKSMPPLKLNIDRLRIKIGWTTDAPK